VSAARGARPGDPRRTTARLAAAGWAWGGDWHTARDYQHFSASGR
jgi:hypothetical protein